MYKEVKNGVVHLGDDYTCKIAGIGDVMIRQEIGQQCLLKDVRHVSALKKNLVSVGQMDDAGFVIAF